jgi:hypothetical protein
MKNALATIGVISALVLTGCLDEHGNDKKADSGPLFRWHFAGRGGLNAATNATRLKAIDALPATAELRKAFAQKLARAAYGFWKNDLPARVSDNTAFLQPLFEDLLSVENCMVVSGPVGKTETVLAAKLTEDRARLWSTNLWQAVTAWRFGNPHPTTSLGAGSWESKRAQAPELFQFVRAGKWVLIGLGQKQLPTLRTWAEQAMKSGRPVALLTNEFLELSARPRAMTSWFPLFGRYPFPSVHLRMLGRGENVRTEARLEYAEKIPGAFDAWQIPTNLVTEPLTSFTVARGIAPWLERNRDFIQLGLRPTPNQICAWGVSNAQCRVYFTLPMPDSTNALRQLAQKVPPLVLSHFTNAIGNFLYVSNKAEVIWELPYIAPYLRATKDSGSEFIFGGDFPPFIKTYPVPDELYSQVRGRNDLVYYDWEDTPQRLEHGQQIFQLISIAGQLQMPATDSVSERWLRAIRPHLGNTVTEIAQTGPKELTLVRKSQVGMTGFELATFSAWLESRGFPFRLELPPPMPRHGTNAAPRNTNATNILKTL